MIVSLIHWCKLNGSDLCRFGAVISVQDLFQAGHLMPGFRAGEVDVSWLSGDVLERADEFYNL
ncbi:hypothetical protein AZE42_10038 [Rhizopogon vesiculosus]|uniref:Uncharacterized protein n=1 Tax=Rhizopogon vesiculosus TaxID=180088 RepID=A0A1J8QSL3_9AGAM|nr:hypothetical protein AZE42_10038 [Rhizopogon vesiculosus]